jgi:hypothetical protein
VDLILAEIPHNPFLSYGPEDEVIEEDVGITVTLSK